jgi:hypothetical protein
LEVGSGNAECGMRNAEKMKAERKKVEIGKEEDEKLEGLGHSAWGRDKSSKLKAEG